MSPQVAIIGAGYAGLAAAVNLTARGIPVTVFETSRVLGGRARKVEASPTLTPGYLDNGQHILIGAYRDTLSLMQQVGVDIDQALLRLPLTLSYPDFRLHAPRLPAPLHMAAALLGAKGLSWRDKWAAIRFMQWLKQNDFRLPTDDSVAHLLDTHQQPASLRRYLWEPLCISALNTPPATASAQVFANVLRDSLAGERNASDLLIPRYDLSALFAEPAAACIRARGSHVCCGTAIGAVSRIGNAYQLDAAPQHTYRQVIVATAPYHAPRLLAGLPELTPLCEQLAALAWEPIVTCYLRYPAGTRLASPMLGLADGHAHWVFDRGQIDGSDGLMAAVISARGQHQALDKNALATAIDAELRTLQPDLPAPLAHQVISEKRATFACTPGLQRPTTTTPLPGLLLAGDYVASDYPATIEGAIRSGLAAAAAISAN